MSDDRAINTVADVSLAIVLLTAAIALVAATPGDDKPDSEAIEADRTAEVASTATLAVPYSVEEVVADMDRDPEYDEADLKRASHGSVANLLADAAVASLADSDQHLTPLGRTYEAAIEGRFQTRFVGSNFETNVTAIYRPYDGAEIGGTATVGEPVPPDVEYSSAHLSVPSGIDPVETTAEARIEHEADFEAVGTSIANALIEGYLPPLDAKRALERSGLERALTVYRYEQMAALVEDTDPEDRRVRRNLPRDSARPARINRYLATRLAAQIADDLQSRYESASAAAAETSTGEVTVVVRTWEP